jgi:hypothetical protein
MRAITKQCIHRYVHLWYYKQRSPSHVLATYCDHFQGGVHEGYITENVEQISNIKC